VSTDSIDIKLPQKEPLQSVRLTPEAWENISRAVILLTWIMH